MSILQSSLSAKVKNIDILDHQDNIEDWQEFQRKVGFEQLTVSFS
ncbi:hypothetical protein [Thalassotalea sp. PS06]|nr:hypothetical protein [Thalassotalea sp. PS06]